MTTHTQNEPTMLGHPKGLFYLFFAELWERFSFYENSIKNMKAERLNNIHHPILQNLSSLVDLNK